MSSREIAIFGGGCFWCTEAVLQQIRGVLSVVPGYAGGISPHPSYEDVSLGTTGHAEVVKIEFDPSLINYRELLTIFFASHDPTSSDRQGADIGHQYRSIIITTNERQKKEAKTYIAELEKRGYTVVTEIQPLDAFYEAEPEHKDFYAHNTNTMYSQAVIRPKMEAVQKKFSNLIKTHL